MTRIQIITPLILTLQIVGIILTLANENIFPLTIITTFSNLYLVFQYKIFQDKIATVNTTVVLSIATIIAYKYGMAIFLTAVPLLLTFVIIGTRQLFIKLTNAEPETGKYLIKQRDRTYTWIILNISLQLLFFSILEPMTENREKSIWILVIFLLVQIPFIFIAWTITKLKSRKRKRIFNQKNQTHSI